MMGDPRNLLLFAGLGTVSGTIVTVSLFVSPLDWKIEVADLLMLSPMSIDAGLAFGIIFGGLLRYRGLAGTRSPSSRYTIGPCAMAMCRRRRKTLR